MATATANAQGIVSLDITAQQAQFLNEYAEAYRRYRNALEQMVYSAEKEIKGRGHGIGHQTLAEVPIYFGAVSTLDKVVYHVFDLPEEGAARREKVTLVQEWLTLAREKNENGMMDQNWFVAVPRS